MDTRSHQLLDAISDGGIELHLGAEKIVVYDAASCNDILVILSIMPFF